MCISELPLCFSDTINARLVSYAMESSLILDNTVATDILNMNMTSTSLKTPISYYSVNKHVTGMVQCVITTEGLWFLWCDKFQHNIHSSLMGHCKE